MKFKGEQRRAVIRARLKFSVLRVERVHPRRRRESDWVSWDCWRGSLARMRAR